MLDDDCQELFSALDSAIKKGATMMTDEARAQPKRCPLASIDANQAFKQHSYFSKDNIWKAEATAQPPSSLPVAFQIYQDTTEDLSPSPQPSKEKRLPLYLRKLYTNQASDSKENDYWDSMDYETDVEDKKKAEARWSAPYWYSIHSYLRERETEFPLDPREILNQSDLKVNMRSILTDWLVEVGDEYNLNDETVHLAVAHVDRYLQLKPVARSQLQLLGTSSLFIACKQYEIYPPELKDFVYITNETYTKKEVLRMEQSILNTLKFHILFPTASTFLDMYAHILESTMIDMAVNLSHYICDTTLLSLHALEFLPSKIGAACLYIARTLVFAIEEPYARMEAWPQMIAERSGYSIDDLRQAAQAIYWKFMHICQTKEDTAVYKKYLDKKYGEVAKYQFPRLLEL